MAEVRVSSDGDSVAIRSDYPEEAWNAWAVMHRVNGGHWSKDSEVSDWDVIVEP